MEITKIKYKVEKWFSVVKSRGGHDWGKGYLSGQGRRLDS